MFCCPFYSSIRTQNLNSPYCYSPFICSFLGCHIFNHLAPHCLINKEIFSIYILCVLANMVNMQLLKTNNFLHFILKLFVGTFSLTAFIADLFFLFHILKRCPLYYKTEISNRISSVIQPLTKPNSFNNSFSITR